MTSDNKQRHSRPLRSRSHGPGTPLTGSYERADQRADPRPDGGPPRTCVLFLIALHSVGPIMGLNVDALSKQVRNGLVPGRLALDVVTGALHPGKPPHPTSAHKPQEDWG